nr:MAG TPA: hypothetical protein [Caudoviricetes sp.]
MLEYRRSTICTLAAYSVNCFRSNMIKCNNILNYSKINDY